MHFCSNSKKNKGGREGTEGRGGKGEEGREGGKVGWLKGGRVVVGREGHSAG